MITFDKMMETAMSFHGTITAIDAYYAYDGRADYEDPYVETYAGETVDTRFRGDFREREFSYSGVNPSDSKNLIVILAPPSEEWIRNFRAGFPEKQVR